MYEIQNIEKIPSGKIVTLHSMEMFCRTTKNFIRNTVFLDNFHFNKYSIIKSYYLSHLSTSLKSF